MGTLYHLDAFWPDAPTGGHAGPSPAAKTRLRPASSRRQRPARIEDDTPLVPEAVARRVLEEAGLWLGTELPPDWVSILARRARTVYARNAPFRRRLRRPGATGRDWLWAFMRHWLSALLRRERPQGFDRLPATYCLGGALPGTSSERVRAHLNVLRA